MRTWPKPVQKPHPPVIVGGAFPYAARRALAYGDGWVPHASRPQYADVTDYLPRFRQMAAEAGRDPASVPVTIFGTPEHLDRLQRYRDLGIARVVVSLPSAQADEILPHSRSLGGTDPPHAAAVVRPLRAAAPALRRRPGPAARYGHSAGRAKRRSAPRVLSFSALR
jgi:alkanesulfonate monooxygenase SsuD/methylene tetrahydromethanopterin reductase-like flavin-dependent oxidoreductase (luciferase family)